MQSLFEQKIVIAFESMSLFAEINFAELIFEARVQITFQWILTPGHHYLRGGGVLLKRSDSTGMPI